MEIIGWIGFAQGLFAALLMFAKKEQELSDRILSGWLVLFALEFLTCALDHRIFGYSLFSSSFLLFNPALFIYTRSLIEKKFKLKWVMLLHLLPFIVFEILAYITKTQFTFKNFFQVDSGFGFRLLMAISTIVSLVVYFSSIVVNLYRYRMNLLNEKSNIDKEQNLNWLMFVTLFYISYSLLAGIQGFIFVFLGVGADALSYYNYSILLLLIYIISFYGLYQKQIEIKTEPGEPQETIAYKNSILTSETKQIIKEKILQYFEKEQAYLNPNLNMDLLSEEINFPKYQITEVLNIEIGKNFFQFVNSYRIEAVKKMLLEPKLKYSIEAIGYECGFNSKSSFYTVFKKITGKTPAAFRESVLGTSAM